MRRIYDWRRVKLHRSYTIPEVVALFDLAECTPYQWIKKGLVADNSERPVLIRGADLREYVHTVNESYKCPCGPGLFYCLRCRSARSPAGNIVEYEAKTSSRGFVHGTCSVCGLGVYKAAHLASLDEAFPGVIIEYKGDH